MGTGLPAPTALGWAPFGCQVRWLTPPNWILYVFVLRQRVSLRFGRHRRQSWLPSAAGWAAKGRRFEIEYFYKIIGNVTYARKLWCTADSKKIRGVWVSAIGIAYFLASRALTLSTAIEGGFLFLIPLSSRWVELGRNRKSRRGRNLAGTVLIIILLYLLNRCVIVSSLFFNKALRI